MSDLNHPQSDKVEAIAKKLYQTFVDTSDEVQWKTWDYLDADEKFNWIVIAGTAIEQVRVMADFQKKAVIEAYKSRGRFAVPDDWSWDEAISDFFNHGWTEAFDSYYDAPEGFTMGLS